MAFTSNLAAINAANAQLKLAYQAANCGPFSSKDTLKAARDFHFKFEKHDGEWHALIVMPLPAPEAPRDPAASLADQREGAFAFPTNNLSKLPLTEDGYVDESKAADQLANEALLQAAQESATGPAPKEWIHKSSVMKPTKLVWIIADEMLASAQAAQLPVPTRKEVQDECIRRGVASGTARTQYQAWKTARDNALKNAEHAAALSAAFNKR